jgi:hypothetical protein
MWLTNIANKKPVRNFNAGQMVSPVQGLILHIQQGHESGTQTWFNDPKSQASAHFGNPKIGRLDQFVDSADKAWAEAAGNRFWISVENEGFSGDSLTGSQVQNLAQLMAWLHVVEKVPLQLADSPTGSGLGYHSMGGAAWGDHPNCPGQPIIVQRTEILMAATALLQAGFDPTK